MFWMTMKYLETPLNKLIIPGTHDSGSYRLTSVKVPNSEAPPSYLKYIGSSVAQTQYLTIFQQLILGARFLDLRIAFDQDKQIFRCLYFELQTL
jgi:hypothetical protein